MLYRKRQVSYKAKKKQPINTWLFFSKFSKGIFATLFLSRSVKIYLMVSLITFFLPLPSVAIAVILTLPFFFAFYNTALVTVAILVLPDTQNTLADAYFFLGVILAFSLSFLPTFNFLTPDSLIFLHRFFHNANGKFLLQSIRCTNRDHCRSGFLTSNNLTTTAYFLLLMVYCWYTLVSEA